MDLKHFKEYYKLRQELNNKYILTKLDIIRNDNINKSSSNITHNEEKLIMSMIKEDYIKERDNLILNYLEKEYESKKLKFFIDKSKYINKKKDIILNKINDIKNYLSRSLNIKNDFSLAYSKPFFNILISSNNSISYLIIVLSSLEKRYIDKLKCLYKLSNNYDEINNIRLYEGIERNYTNMEHTFLAKKTNIIGNNIKILRHNSNNIDL